LADKSEVGLGTDVGADRGDARDASQDSFMCTPGTKCGPNLTKFCNSSGMCVDCLSAADCQNPVTECTARACNNGACGTTPRPGGTLCNMFMDQCDGLGNCVDCFDNGGCGECCVCSMGHCIPASK
jgi:hypothetical protein